MSYQRTGERRRGERFFCGVFTMKITTSDLRKDLPPVIESADGSVNSVLALSVDTAACKCSQIFSRWTICNTVYYNQNPDQFEGWVELENLQWADPTTLPECTLHLAYGRLNKLLG